MSGFTGATGPQGGVGVQQAERTNIDRRLLADHYRDQPWSWVVDVEPFDPRGFATPWWPARSAFDSAGGEELSGVRAMYMEMNTGAVSKMAFTGVTRDAYGTALPGCTVKLFKTLGTQAWGNVQGSLDVTDCLIDSSTSDATTGAFTLYSPFYPDTHYIVSYKAGSPDTEGVTVNTLTGA